MGGICSAGTAQIEQPPGLKPKKREPKKSFFQDQKTSEKTIAIKSRHRASLIRRLSVGGESAYKITLPLKEPDAAFLASQPAPDDTAEQTKTKRRGSTFRRDKAIEETLERTEEDVLENHRHMVLGKSEEMEAQSKPSGTKDITIQYPKMPDEMQIIVGCLQNHFLFCTFYSETLKEIANAMEPETIEAGQVLFEEGLDPRHDDKFYIVKSGTFEQTETAKESFSYPTETGERGFGDMALCHDSKRASTVTAVCKGVVWTLHRDHFHHIAIETTKFQSKRVHKVLSKLEIMKQVSDTQLMAIIDHLVSVVYEDGEVIIKQGTEAENFYIVEQGSVTMHKGRNRKELISLGPGEFFGERAFLSGDVLRESTFIAKGIVTCLVLGKTEFKEMCGDLKEGMDKVHQERIKTVAELFALKEIDPRELEMKTIVGRGSFGVVHMAKWNGGGEHARVVAVKQIVKTVLVETSQMFNVVREKVIMQMLVHPYIVRLYCTYSSRDCVYFVMEYMPGGHLYHLLWKSKLKFTMDQTLTYSACIADSLMYMHTKNILYRDLKLENICLNEKGEVKVIDFGLSKNTTRPTYTTAGTPEYMAPEMITGRGHHKAVDYWALGILIYEMLCGSTPFGLWVNKKPPPDMLVFQRLFTTAPCFPTWFDTDAEDLVLQLLNKVPSTRLGSATSGGVQFRSHPFFKKIDWEKLRRGEQEVIKIKDVEVGKYHSKINEKLKDFVPPPYVKSTGKKEITMAEKQWAEHFPLIQ